LSFDFMRLTCDVVRATFLQRGERTGRIPIERYSGDKIGLKKPHKIKPTFIWRQNTSQVVVELQAVFACVIFHYPLRGIGVA